MEWRNTCLLAQMQIADLLFGRFRGSSSVKEDFIVQQKKDVKNKATWQQDKATTISIMAIVCTDTTHLSNSAQLDLTATDAVLTSLPLNLRNYSCFTSELILWGGNKFEGRQHKEGSPFLSFSHLALVSWLFTVFHGITLTEGLLRMQWMHWFTLLWFFC